MVKAGSVCGSASSSTEPISVRSRATGTTAEAVAAEDIEDDVEDGHDDLWQDV